MDGLTLRTLFDEGVYPGCLRFCICWMPEHICGLSHDCTEGQPCRNFVLAGGEEEGQAAYDEAMNAVFTLQLECHRHTQPHRSKKDGTTKWAMIEMWPMLVSVVLLGKQHHYCLTTSHKHCFACFSATRQLPAPMLRQLQLLHLCWMVLLHVGLSCNTSSAGFLLNASQTQQPVPKELSAALQACRQKDAGRHMLF